jgi:leader peptidase (prepilin peptidase) / N-methyltransferase
VTGLPLDEWPGWLLQAFAALVGAMVGSFLNVVIARLPAGQSVVTPRSRCPRCGQAIAWYDNLPVLSWLLLRARCRACREPISIRYPLVELAGGAAGWLALARHGPTPRALAEFTLVALLLALAAIDLDTWLLPHRLTWPLLALGLAAAGLGISPAPSLGSAALGGALGFGAFALVSLVSERLLGKEALGFGDVFLLAGLGAWLGAGALLPLVLLASLQGSVVGLALILVGRSQPGPEVAPGSRAAAGGEEAPWVPPRHALPFGPFLVAGALEWLWLGERLGSAIPLFGVFR